MILSLLSCKRLILIRGELNPDSAKQRTEVKLFTSSTCAFEVNKFFRTIIKQIKKFYNHNVVTLERHLHAYEAELANRNVV